MSSGPILYPNVTSLPSQVDGLRNRGEAKDSGRGIEKKGEFDQVFEQAMDLNQVKEPLKFSAHASQRMQDRRIKLDQQTMAKVNDAIDKAAAKGVEDTLILTGDTALIVSVKNRTVITALDRSSMQGNVFTNIDGAVII